MHRDYLMEHNTIRFNDLCLSGAMNSIRNRAEEIIKAELIYN